EWMGKDGALEQVEKIGGNRGEGGKFGGWKAVTPKHNALMDAITASPCHIIATLRAKTQYGMEAVEENGRSKNKVIKYGVGAIQREGAEYEFDIKLDMDLSNTATVDKTRCPALRGRVFPEPGRELIEIVK